MHDYDLIIAGGGMVGASLAHAVARCGLRVAVIEPVAPAASSQPSYDDRAIALAYGTRRILEGLGVWSALAPDAEPIRSIHVSDRGHFGFTHLDARDEEVEALGYVVTARDLGRVLLEPLTGRDVAVKGDRRGEGRRGVALKGDVPGGQRGRGVAPKGDLRGDRGGRLAVDLWCPARVADFTVEADRVTVELASPSHEGTAARDAQPEVAAVPKRERGATRAHPSPGRVRTAQQPVPRTLTARLLVAADGGRSAIRDKLGLAQRHLSYGHHAVIANVTPSQPHRGVAYERFTDSGPLALLPMTGNRCGLIWTARDTDVDAVVALDDHAFLASLQERFGFRLGRFTAVGARSHYPLELRLAQTQVVHRVALIGNAAHTVHPIAGQGFNLGIRDVAALADVLLEAHGTGRDIGSLEVLGDYEGARVSDQRTVAFATDGLARLFINPLPPLRIARNLAMMAMDGLPPLRHLLARQAMGLRGPLPRLARGLGHE
jgi:ubiquinone biosynthesis UbiH/UbiF/VisC/COQ6 family hydroxylase